MLATIILYLKCPLLGTFLYLSTHRLYPQSLPPTHPTHQLTLLTLLTLFTYINLLNLQYIIYIYIIYSHAIYSHTHTRTHTYTHTHTHTYIHKHRCKTTGRCSSRSSVRWRQMRHWPCASRWSMSTSGPGCVYHTRHTHAVDEYFGAGVRISHTTHTCIYTHMYAYP